MKIIVPSLLLLLLMFGCAEKKPVPALLGAFGAPGTTTIMPAAANNSQDMTVTLGQPPPPAGQNAKNVNIWAYVESASPGVTQTITVNGQPFSSGITGDKHEWPIAGTTGIQNVIVHVSNNGAAPANQYAVLSVPPPPPNPPQYGVALARYVSTGGIVAIFVEEQ